MQDQDKPVREFSARRTVNGGWIIAARGDFSRPGEICPEYSYSNDSDMLDALPELIGHQLVPDAVAKMSDDQFQSLMKRREG